MSTKEKNNKPEKLIDKLRALSPEALNEQMGEANKELFAARLKKAQQQLENTALLGQLRDRIAKIKTVLREKELAATK